MLSIDLTLVPSASVIIAGLNRFSGEIRSAREPLERAVDEVVRPAIRENFASQSARGAGWDELKPATVKRRRGSSRPILYAPPVSRKEPGSPHLRQVAQQKNIWTFETGGDVAEAFVKELPSSVFYGEYHHYGTHAMAERPFFVIDGSDMARIEEIFKEWYEQRTGVIL